MAAKKSGGKKSTKSGGVKKGMGFQAAATRIAAKEGVSPSSARAILASGTRKASPAARKANPNLKKVLPKKKGS